jgi:hypothetical protein
MRRAACRFGFGTWVPAARLIVRSVSPTTSSHVGSTEDAPNGHAPSPHHEAATLRRRQQAAARATHPTSPSSFVLLTLRGERTGPASCELQYAAMEDHAEFVESHLTPDRRILWPAEDPATLGRTMLGVSFVSSLDYWIDLAVDYVTNPDSDKAFPRKNEAWKRDRAYRSVFAQLTVEQRGMVLKLVREVAHGVLFSTMVDVDQFSPADVRITLVERDESEQVVRNVEIYAGNGDLHDEFCEWVARFSKHAEQLEADLLA